MLISIYVFGFWGLRSQTPTRALPLDPPGGLLSPVPRFCPPPKQISGYAPALLRLRFPVTRPKTHLFTIPIPVRDHVMYSARAVTIIVILDILIVHVTYLLNYFKRFCQPPVSLTIIMAVFVGKSGGGG